MRTIRLSKLQATGNDFLVWSWLHEHAGVPELDAAEAAALCDRHRGVGADGLIVIRPGTDGADAAMLLFNADGGVAEMSGNGMRALAWVAAREGLGRSGTLDVDTGAGRRHVELTFRPGTREVVAATVDMGPVTFEPAADPARRPVAVRPPGRLPRHDATRVTPPAWGTRTSCCSSTTPPPPGSPNTVRTSSTTAASRIAPTSSSSRAPPAPPTSSHAGLGARRRRDAELRYRRVRGRRRRTPAGFVGACVVVHVPGGDLVVELGDTIRLGGPVVHVFDVEVEVPETRLPEIGV